MIKQLTIFFALFWGFIAFSIPVNAQEQVGGLEYSLLENNPKKETYYIDSSGELIHLSISLVSEPTRVNAGTYRITKSSPGNWTASYDIRVNGSRQITAANNKRFTTPRGSIVSSSLTHSSTRAVCSFRYRSGLITSNQSVTATISNGRIVIT